MIKNDIVITDMNPGSPASEAYRVLRTNLQFINVDKPLKTIVITSAGPEEGKTTTIVNLSVVFAKSQKKVLLIDADLRRPKIHKIFNLPNKNGLSNLVIKHSDYREFVNTVDKLNIDIITSGQIPPNPSEMLNSNSFKQYLADFKEDYDVVLIDSPPVISVTDAMILSKLVDGTVLVACCNKVKIDDVRKTIELLENVNSNIVGVVLNKTSHNKKHYYYYYQSTDEEQD